MEIQKNRFKPQGTILRDYSGQWWIIEKYHLHYACASFVEMLSYDKYSDGNRRRINFDPDSVDRMIEVTKTELVLYGQK